MDTFIAPPDARHDAGFRNVHWFGVDYQFTPNQARCVQVLWRSWLSGTPIIRQALVLESARVRTRSLRDVFREAPGAAAWGTMIADDDRRGTVRLLEPAPPTLVKDGKTTNTRSVGDHLT